MHWQEAEGEGVERLFFPYTHPYCIGHLYSGPEPPMDPRALTHRPALMYQGEQGPVISLNLTKSSPDLGLPRSILDLSDYSVHPRSPDLGPISDYSDHLWSPTSVPPRITRNIRLLGLSMTFYGLPHLDLLISLSCHSLNLTYTRLALRDPVSTPLGSLGTASIHSPGSCTSPSLRLVLSLSTTLSVFGHCLSIVLYKPRLCSTSSSVRISRRVLVSSPRHHITVFIPMPP